MIDSTVWSVENGLKGSAVVLTVLLAVQLTVYGVETSPEPSQPETLAARWVNSPDSLAEAVKLSESIVVGKVMKIDRAEDFVIKPPGNPGKEKGEEEVEKGPSRRGTEKMSEEAREHRHKHDRDEGEHAVDVARENKDTMVLRIPNEVLMINVQKVLKGESVGKQLSLYHTGLSYKPTRRGSERGKRDVKPPVLNDDPAYRRGERYLLFLSEGPEMTVGGERIQTRRLISPEGRFLIKQGKLSSFITPRTGFVKEFHGSRPSIAVRQITKTIEKVGEQTERERKMFQLRNRFE